MPEDPQGDQGVGAYGAYYGHNRASAYDGWGYGYGGAYGGGRGASGYGYGYPGSNSLYRSRYNTAGFGGATGYGRAFGGAGSAYGGAGSRNFGMHGRYGYGHNNFANQAAIQGVGSLDELQSEGF